MLEKTKLKVSKMKNGLVENRAYIGGLVATAVYAAAATPMAYADAGTTMINGILDVVKLIVRIVGIIFAIVGIVKFAIAHADDNGPGQQKAGLMVATGVVLVLLPTFLDGINFAGMING